jgi:hypothetical protein
MRLIQRRIVSAQVAYFSDPAHPEDPMSASAPGLPISEGDVGSRPPGKLRGA